jgi:hypothetical protein
LAQKTGSYPQKEARLLLLYLYIYIIYYIKT